jgi:hypothetical protein
LRAAGQQARQGLEKVEDIWRAICFRRGVGFCGSVEIRVFHMEHLKR